MSNQRNLDETCPICYYPFENQTNIMHDVNGINTKVCTHIFCQSCIVQWISHCNAEQIDIHCPVCRRLINI